jgi:uncharacterized protein (TIGR00369 family)
MIARADGGLDVEQIQDLVGRSLFHQLLRPWVIDINPDTATLTLKFPMRDDFERQPGTRQWHGGMISAIVDIAGCYAFMSQAIYLPPTINFRVDYLQSAVDTDLTAYAKLRRTGRSIGVVDVEVHCDRDQLIALGRATYFIGSEASRRHPTREKGSSC